MLKKIKIIGRRVSRGRLEWGALWKMSNKTDIDTGGSWVVLELQLKHQQTQQGAPK